MGMSKFWEKTEKEYIVYKDEAIALMAELGVNQSFIDTFKEDYPRYRSYPYEIMNFYTKYYPAVEIKKEIPAFLLKQSA